MGFKSAATLHLPPLARKSTAQLRASANRLGIPPEAYAKRLVEDALAMEREAEPLTFAQIMAPVRRAAGAVGEDEIVKLVETARADHHRRAARTTKS